LVVRATAAALVSGIVAVVIVAVVMLQWDTPTKPRHGVGHVMIGPTGNHAEMVPPHKSRYLPDISHASRADRELARVLLRGANQFCRTHSATELAATWKPGSQDPSSPTHLFNPATGSLGLDPSNPRAALIYQGEIGGVMLTGSPLPSLGSIPRAHAHDMAGFREMIHVYCTKSLREAFTPNRVLGVLADVIDLRRRIRPRIAEVPAAQVPRMLASVRQDAGSGLRPVPVARRAAAAGPDPILQAKREEIRRSLMMLTERELRTLWSAVRSLSS
jgi:hypothetical protein